MNENLEIEWHNERRKISALVPFTKNPRQMTEKQAGDLRRSIEKFNLVEIPAVNLDGTIIAGHQRLKIMALLGRGEEEIDVRMPSRQLTEGEVTEYCIRSNKDTGEWDFDLLANNFEPERLIDWGFFDWELGLAPHPSEPPEKDLDESIVKTSNECPSCGYKW